MATKKNNNMVNENKNMNKNMNATRVVCPNCGAEFEIPEHETTAKNVTVIGADSNLGTIYLKLKDRQEQLTTAGIDVNKYFSMKTPGGVEKLMKWEGDTPVPVTADDPVMKMILDGGTVPNRDLFRRWVMAQVFTGLTYDGYYGSGFTAWMHGKGYEYTWKMTEEEFRVQAKLWKKGDNDNFQGRNRWFDKTVANEMAKDYIEKLEADLKNRKPHHCKGVPYIKIGGRNVFVSDVTSKIISPLNRLQFKIRMAKDPEKLYKAFCEFNAERIKLGYNVKESTAWIDAYKGAGAYYTMKNMVLFHGCKFRNGKYSYMNKAESVRYLEAKAEEYKGEGWRLFGLMKKLIEDNHIDIAAKQAEWHEKKARKMNW